MLALDPRSGDLGGQFRIPAGCFVDLLRANPQFEASKITAPTLVIRGTLETLATHEDSKVLTDELGTRTNKLVEIPEAKERAEGRQRVARPARG